MPKETPEQKSARMKQQWANKKAVQKSEIEDTVLVEEDPYGITQEQWDRVEEIRKNNRPLHEESRSTTFGENETVTKGFPTEGNEMVFETLDTVISEKVFEPVKQEPVKNNYMQSDLMTLEAPKLKVNGQIAIKAYSSGEDKMGLELHNEALFPGTYQIDRIGCGKRNGYITYITGLDEQASEVQLLNPEKKKAVIQQIRETVAYLENTISNNFDVSKETCMEGYGTAGDTFWKNVKTFNSSGPDKFDAKGDRVPTYWDSVELQVGNDGKNLDLTNPHDIVIYHAIQAGGLSLIAPSLQAAMDEPGYNFYLDSPIETASIKTQFMKLRNKAGGALDAMYESDHSKLFYMTKCLVPIGSAKYRRGGPNSTPLDVLYENLGNYLDGKTEESDPRIAIRKFLDSYDYPIDELIRKAIIKDATELHFIDVKGDGQLYYTKTNTRLGQTVEDISEFLKNPLNEAIKVDMFYRVETEWAR